MNKRLTVTLLVGAAIAIALLALYPQRVFLFVHYQRTMFDHRFNRLKYTVAATKADRHRHHYFGVIRDQDGLPIRGVAVSFSIHRWNAKAEGGVAYSDADGTFSITNQVGLDLEIYRLEKPGYTPQIWSSTALNAAKANNSPTNRTVIQMWKLKGPEELITVAGDFDITPNKGPVAIDLTTARFVQTGGDIKISVDRAATKTNRYEPFDWSYRIEAVEGGIQETDDLHYFNSFVAPSGGYQPFLEKKFLRTDPHPLAQDSEYFFVVSRNKNVFSKFGFTIYANTESGRPVSIHLFKGVANPNASPNWEEDPAKMHPPK